MATTGAAKAKQSILPKSATITIRDQAPKPDGKAEVAPWTGTVRFANKDKEDYRLRFRKPNTEPLSGIDILLPAKAHVTVMIKRGDEFTSACFTLKVMKPLPAEAAGPLLIDPLESYSGHHSLGARLHRKIGRPEGVCSRPFLWKYRQWRGLRLTSARGLPERHTMHGSVVTDSTLASNLSRRG